MTLDARRAGEALRAAAGDLARVWRASRLAAGMGVFPGALDGVIEEFLERVSEALFVDGAPQDPWAATSGVVRLLPAPRALELFAGEWRLARVVLSSACDALGVEPAVAARVLGMVDDAARRAGELADGRGPAGVLAVRQLGGFRQRAAPPDGRSGGPR
ncbi:MAG TPA: hypothetical protein VEB43_17825 [Anaeromyxobacter sp.]|nr:hypothetical protein [Anaeromyxobacter sp.]